MACLFFEVEHLNPNTQPPDTPNRPTLSPYFANSENYILQTYLYWGEFEKGDALIDSFRENAKDCDGEVDHNALHVQCIAAADVLQQHGLQQQISQYRQQLASIARAAYLPLSETLQESEEEEVSPPEAFEWSENC